MIIELGDKVRDKVTGFVGVATARNASFDGTAQYSVEGPVLPDGTLEKSYWFDQGRLELVESRCLAGPTAGSDFKDTDCFEPTDRSGPRR